MVPRLTYWAHWLAKTPRLVTRKAERTIARQLLFPLALEDGLHRHGLHRFDAGDALHQEGLVLRPPPKLLLDAQPKRRRRQRRDQTIQRHAPSDDQAEGYGVTIDNRQEDRRKHQIQH